MELKHRVSPRNKLEETLQSCYRHMLRYMAGVSLSDRVASNEVASRCGVKALLQLLQESKLRWFGHVKRRRGASVLGEVMEMEVTGTTPRGRPKNVWTKNIEEDQ